ncbi:hypothetical protein FRC08_005095 [Ceratobasidium sp. 394]|nr:hypothetical protein FRC08_005095 [Ceratobasidium sp. 394]KAG9086803.1 hypothetical protein FS749_003368 [Ceratobasidium sp. UAMH 11750]
MLPPAARSEREGSVSSQVGNDQARGRRRTRDSSPARSDSDNVPPPAKRPQIVLSAKKRTTDEYGVAARMITRIHSMTWEPFRVVNAGVTLVAIGADGDLDAVDEEFENATGNKRVLYDLFHILCERIPGLTDTTEWAEVRRRLDDGKRAARTEDNHTLKRAIPKWRRWSPPLKDASKRDRGLNHPECAMLLAPISVDWSKEEERTRFRTEHKPPMTANQRWPAFLYKNYKGDVANMAEGLLQSDLMVKGARILVFPASIANADDEPDHKSNRKSKAQTYGMTSVTPEFLAYVAVGIRYALSSESSFLSRGGLFNYEKFYADLVNHLKDPACKEDNDKLIDWWNTTLFPQEDADSEDEPEGMVSELRRQALARQQEAFDAAN